MPLKNQDEIYMARALKLAMKGWGLASPNPMVGALVVKGGKVIAEGFHERAGAPHAEAVALGLAGERARGAALYVSLEPCCHLKKRTPPCTGAIIRSGVKKVVAAMLDPNPAVSGKGVQELRGAGIEVKTGVLEAKTKILNEAYIKYIITGTPFVTLKAAMSLDGKIATSAGQSKWITGQAARRLAHRVRSGVDAILTAVGTVAADDPEMTARTKGGKNPIRVVIDPELRSPLSSKIFMTPPATFVVTRKTLPAALASAGVEAINFKGRLSLEWLMKKLGAMGVTSVLIEGGSSLNAHAFEEGVVDKAMFFYGPKILGGTRFPAIAGQGAARLQDAWRLRDLTIKKVDEDMLVTGYVLKNGGD